MPLALFGDFLLYFRDGPAIEKKIGGRSRNVCHWFNSRLQLIYRITHRLAEVVHPLSIHSPVKGCTNIGAEQPELDVILFIDHRILPMCEPCTFRHKRRGHTRIMVRMMATEPKTALAGGILEISLVRCRLSMAMFSKKRTPSCPFGCWDLSAMVETQGSCEEVGRYVSCAGMSEP